MEKGNAREAALEILLKIDKNNAWADALLNKTIQQYELDRRDAALCARITYGVLQNKYLIEYYINPFLKKNFESLDTVIRNILLIGSYQILFMDKIPVHAAVNEAVDSTKKNHYAKASGLVNAVLHKICTIKNNLPPVSIKDPIKRMSITYTMPEWLLTKLSFKLDNSELEAFCISCNEAVETTIQTNTLKTDSVELENMLAEQNIEFEKHRWLENCFLSKGFGSIESLSLYRDGLFYIQDSSSKLIAYILPKYENLQILDVCAAPGGKSIAMALKANNRCHIISCDIYENKLKLLKDQCQRLGITCIQTMVKNGKEYEKKWEDLMDLVVVDAPCSGIGIIRKKPDIRYKNPANFNNLPVVQMSILNNASKYVKSKGHLIYSTCTILEDENEHVLNTFLSQHPEYKLKPFTLPEPIGKTPGYVTIWPQKHHSDGFFISLLEKN